jgi:hypothetical protein
MALGAIYWLRGESGWSAQKNPMGNSDPAENLSSDFIDLYRHVAHEGFTLQDPGNVEPIECEDTDDMLGRIARKGMAATREEESYNTDEDADEDEELSLWCSDQSIERAHGWLRKGYREATERYDGIDAYSLAECVFEVIEKRVSDWLQNRAEEGMILDVEVDLSNYSVTIEAGYGDGSESEYCPECEGEGELDGEDHGNYHDCPEGCTEEGKDDCKGCAGKGYIAPPVKCDHCDGEGEVPVIYREAI